MRAGAWSPKASNPPPPPPPQQSPKSPAKNLEAPQPETRSNVPLNPKPKTLNLPSPKP